MTVQGQEKVYKNLTRVEQAMADGARQGLLTTLLLIERQAKTNLADLEAVDRGIARNSIDHQIIRRGKLKWQGVVFVGAEHGQWIEFGRKGAITSPLGTDSKSAKAAWPPVSVLSDWVRRHAKQLAPRGRTKSGRARRSRDEDIRSLTFLIGRAIYQFGIAPRPFLGPAFALHSKALPRVVQQEITVRLRRT